MNIFVYLLQSDDRTLRIWRTLDWQQETSITEPFEECGGTTHVLRLSWSPDGQYIVSAHAMNNSGPTAQIIERNGWKANLDFVGHRKAITCVRFNPNILRKKIKKNSEKPQQYSCCAIGSRDRSLSVWLTALKRPLVVMHDLFNNSVLDLSWTRKGFELLCCSVDGTVAYLSFSEEEIGKPLTKEEMAKLHKDTYGKSLAVSSSSNTAASQVIETAAMLNLQQMQKRQQMERKQQVLNQSAGDSPQKGQQIHSKQIETRTKDGRRRITPIFLAPQPDLGEAPLPFDASSNNTILSTSSTETSKIIIERKDLVSPTGRSPESNKSFGSPPSSSVVPMQTSTPEKNRTEEISEDPLASLPKSAALSALQDKDSDLAALTEDTDASDKEGARSSATETPDVDRSISKFKHKEQTPSKLSLKRKHHALTPDGQPVTKKRGRPPKNRDIHGNKIPSAASTPVMSAVTHTPTPVQSSVVSERIVYNAESLNLPAASSNRTTSVTIAGSASMNNYLSLEIENDISVGHTKIHKICWNKCGQTVWESVLTSRILSVVGNKHYACAACEDGSLSMFSASGRKMFPPVMMNSKICVLKCTGHFLMAITIKGSLFVWNLKKLTAVIKNESLTSIIPSNEISIESASLMEHGLPLISLSNGHAYTFNADLASWLLLANKDDCLFLCADYHNCVSSIDVFNQQGSLSALQSQKHRGGNQASRLFRSNPSMQQSCTVSHLESQMVSSLAMKSPGEYKFWLMTYVRYLVQEGLESRLRDTCDELLGPAHGSRQQTKWEPSILGHIKRTLLQEILPIIGSNLSFQRLFTEYQEQLESVL